MGLNASPPELSLSTQFEGPVKLAAFKQDGQLYCHVFYVLFLLLARVNNFGTGGAILCYILCYPTHLILLGLPLKLDVPLVEEDEFGLAVVDPRLPLALGHFRHGDLVADGRAVLDGTAEELVQLVLAPLVGVLLGPVPVVHVGRVRALLHDPARVSLAPLGHTARSDPGKRVRSTKVCKRRLQNQRPKFRSGLSSDPSDRISDSDSPGNFESSKTETLPL